jgi:hypothetical protein
MFGGLKMLRTLNTEVDLARLNPCDDELVIAFVPTNREIYRVLQACHQLKTVYVHPDTFKEMPCVGQTLFYMQKVKLVVDANVPKSSPQEREDALQSGEEVPPQPRLLEPVMVSR